MDYDSKNLTVVELETENDTCDLVEETVASGVDYDTGDRNSAATHSPGVVIGTLSAWDDAGNPLVDYSNNPSECFLQALTTVPLNQAVLGREVALMFVNGDPWQPLIIGLLQPIREGEAPAEPSVRSRPPLSAEIDGERLVFTAKEEIVLQCGHASLTLTKAGKVLIRGSYL